MNDKTSAAHMKSGTIIGGRYRVDELIGRGGMGQVWRATQLGLGRPVAIKIMHAKYAADPVTRRRFEREARVGAALRHRGAVEVYDYGEHEGELYLVLELLLGQTLTAFVRQHTKLTIERAVDITLQLADTLHAAHAMGLVHRDLKPDNIFLDKTSDGYTVKIVDFGLAFIADQGNLGRLTRDGIVSGTPEYIAPEQAMGLEVTPKADIYALGIVLFEMLSGRLPFTGTLGELVSAHLYTPPPLLRKKQPDVPAALEQLVASMLEKEPDARPDATGVSVALRPFVDGIVYERTGWAQGRSDGPVDQAPSTKPLGQVANAPLNRQGRALDEGMRDDRAERETADIARPLRYGVYVVGELPQAQHTALAAAGLVVHTAVDDKTDAIFAPGLALEDLTHLLGRGLPVVSDVLPEDTERGAALLRLGVADAVPRPLNPSEVARKVHRCAVRHRRRLEKEKARE